MVRTYSLMPPLKITELLLEVDSWTDFTRHFQHLKTGANAEDQSLLITAILANAINLGLSKMAECCPGTTYTKPSWLQAWLIRDETYSASLAELINAQLRHPFAAHWGTGTTSSSDGQNSKGGRSRLVRGPSQFEIRPRTRRAVLYPHLGPVRAIPHQGDQSHRARCNPCSRWLAVPRVRPPNRGTLHRYRRLYRSCLRTNAPARVPVCSAHP